MKYNNIIILLAFLFLSACTTKTEFSTPNVIHNNNYISDKASIKLDDTQDFVDAKLLDKNWWNSFSSKKLSKLIETALKNNTDIKSAMSTLQQSYELYNAKYGDLNYPQISAETTTTKQRYNSSASGNTGNASEFSLYKAGLNLNYIFDFSGANKNILEALAAKTDYQKYKLEALRLTLISNIVINAITQAKISEEISIVKSILDIQKKQLDIIKDTIKLGQASKESEIEQQIKIEQTNNNLAILNNILQQKKHEMALLIGKEPSIANLPSFTLMEFELPKKLPHIVPSELVHSRPDILASEALLKVANAEYKVSISKLYPQVTLMANIGTSTLTPSNLFSSSSIIWSIVGQITQAIFKPGLSAEKRASLAAFNVAIANYKSVVLEALLDVANALYDIDANTKKLNAISKSDKLSQESIIIAENKYKLGAISYIDLLIAQEQRKAIELTLIDIKADRLVGIVAFFQALGGGYMVD